MRGGSADLAEGRALGI